MPHEQVNYRTNRQAPRFNRRRLLQGTAATTAGLAAIGLVGCGGDDDDDDDSSTPAPGGQPTPATSPAVGQPVKGGTLRIAENSAPATWDPYVNASGPAQGFWGHMTNRVLRRDPDDPDGLSLEPDVGASIPEQPDGQTVIIKVRDNVTYQDIAPVNGRKLTAEDVAFSIQRYKDIGQQKSQLGAIETIEVNDDTTITLKLNRPTVGLIAVLGDPKAVWLMAKEVAQEEIGPTGPFIGTGPFMFDSYQTDVQINYTKNPNYWETGLPHVDRAEVPIVESFVTEMANFRSGQLDHFAATNKADYEELRAIDGVQESLRGDGGMQRMEFALHVPPFNNRMVRQAMSMAIDRDAMALGNDFIDYKWATHAFPAKWYSWVLDPKNPDEFGENAKYFQYNPTEAKAMLSAAGYEDGFEVPLHLTFFYVGAQVYAELMTDQFSKLGVTVTLDVYPYTEYQEKYKNSKPVTERLWEGIFHQAPASYTDPTLHFQTYWLPTSGRNTQLYEDPWLVEMVAKQDQEIDPEARIELLQEILRHMAFEMNGAPLLTSYSANLWHKRLKNVSFLKNSAGGRAVETDARLWIDENA